jgi:hypothetical protein
LCVSVPQPVRNPSKVVSIIFVFICLAERPFTEGWQLAHF